MSCSKVRPMPPWICTQSWRSSDPYCADEGLGRTGQLAGLGRSGGHRLGRHVADGVAGLEPGLHVGEPVLQLLVGGEGPSERVAVERPLDGHVQCELHGADRLGVGHDHRQLELVLDLAGSPPDLAEHGVGGQPHVLEGDLREPTGEVDRVHRSDRDAGRVGRDEDLGEPGPGPAGHEQVAGLPGRLDRPLDAVQDDVGPVDPDLRWRCRRDRRCGRGSR